MSIEISPNASKYVGVFGEDNWVEAANVTISTATFEVFDSDGESVQGSASATIADNGTPTPDIYGLVDGSNLTLGQRYEVAFLITVGSEIYEIKRHVYCQETSV